MAANIHKEIYENLPGADKRRLEFTRKAYRMLPPMQQPNILDAGCGEGKPAMELVKLGETDITALDIDRDSLDKLQKKARSAGVSDRIHPVRGSLLNMPFADSAFDVIWAEATLHIVGIEKGLRLWRRFLKSGGLLVIHECLWLREDPPKEAADYWRSWFAGIRTADHFADAITAAGYDVLEYFKLPEDLWWCDYFQPLETRLEQLRQKYVSDREALKLLAREQTEVDVYKKYPEWFGSGFFLAQKQSP